MLNRGVGRRAIFHRDGDYLAFERIFAQALARVPGVHLLVYCLMPNHWHLMLRPAAEGELSQLMRWLTVTHTQRYHAAHHTAGTGHIYQGRVKSFPVFCNPAIGGAEARSTAPPRRASAASESPAS